MKKPVLYLLLEILLCMLCAAAPLVLSLWPQDILVVLAWMFSHVLYPVCAFILPMIAAGKGAPAFLCALPPFLIYLPGWILLGLSLPAVPTILSLVLSVLGANTGAEICKRRKKER